jgi:hypothetical protein
MMREAGNGSSGVDSARAAKQRIGLSHSFYRCARQAMESLYWDGSSREEFHQSAHLLTFYHILAFRQIAPHVCDCIGYAWGLPDCSMPPFATRPGVTAPRRGASSAIVVVPLPASSSSSSSSSPSLWDVSEDVCTVLVEDEIMPEPVKFLGGRVKADYNVRMSWDFEANLFNLPPEGIKVKQEQLGSVPLRGDWCFSLSSKYAQPRILVEHGRLAYAAHGERVTVTGELAYFADGKLHVIGTTPWLASEPGPGRNAEGTAYGSYPFTLSDAETAALPPAVQSSVQKYRFTITCTQEPEKDVARLYRTPTLDSAKALQLASALTFAEVFFAMGC